MYPSLSLQIALRSLNLTPKDITINLGDSIELGSLSIKTSQNLLMNTFFYNDREGSSAFAVDSFYDVLQGKIPASKYKGKIVLIGATAVGVGDTMVTPINSNMARYSPSRTQFPAYLMKISLSCPTGACQP
jgi:serine/threonine-protein kinase